jgi:hypothetical protein
MPFGQHKGIPIERVDPGWLQWARDQSDRCNPADPAFWPELRAAIVTVIGEPVPGQARPRVMSLPALCALLAGRGIRIAAKAGELITSETITDGELRDALRVHKAALLALIAIVDPHTRAGTGSARLLWAADLRCRIKAWFGAMSRQFHPDLGGSTDGQVAVNRCYKTLMETFNEWESAP